MKAHVLRSDDVPFVRLASLSPTHVSDLEFAGADERIWRFLYVSSGCYEREGMAGLVARYIQQQADGRYQSYAVVNTVTDQASGVICLEGIDWNRRTAENSTWIDVRLHGSGMNAAAKILLMGHAFASLGMDTLEFRVQAENVASVRAIQRLDIRVDHQYRDVDYGIDIRYYRVSNSFWPHVEEKLRARMLRQTSHGGCC